jgi:hypothetical protein
MRLGVPQADLDTEAKGKSFISTGDINPVVQSVDRQTIITGINRLPSN